jgi:hypothetical protein
MGNRKLTTVSSLDKDNLNTLYEELREEALGTSLNHYRKSQGLALLIQKGMAAWIEAWTNCTSSHLPVKRGEANRSQRNLPVDLHREVAILLTNMALRICQEAKTI